MERLPYDLETYQEVVGEIKELSTELQVDEFLDSPVWYDIKNLVTKRLWEVREQLENVSLSTAPNFIGHLQGEIKTLKFFLDLPKILAIRENEQEQPEGTGII